jgi:hypothetical protein
VLAVDTIPLHALSISDSLLRLLMRCVFTAAAAELAEFQTLSRGLFVLRRYVITALAITALQHNIVTRHNSFPIPIADLK